MAALRIVLAGWALVACAAGAQTGTAETGPAKQEREAPATAGQLSPVGKGTQMGRKDLQPGAYIGPRHRTQAQAWIGRHRGDARAAEWSIGEPLQKGAAAKPAPADLLGVLPPTPPGLRYVVLGDAVLLMASNSRMVVDAVTRNPPSSSPR